MAIDQSQVSATARLARLAIENTRLADYQKDLNKIFTMVGQLQAVDSSEKPMTHPLGGTQRLRDDEVTETDQHKTLQALAPAVSAELYSVPQVIEDSE